VQRLLNVFSQRHTDDVARRYFSDFLLWLLCFFFPKVADVFSQEKPKVFVLNLAPLERFVHVFRVWLRLCRDRELWWKMPVRGVQSARNSPCFSWRFD
jgi:hypothetical protein